MRSFFQFAFRCNDGSTKFILVETVTAEQAECLKEAVASGLDERCILLACFTDCSAAQTFNGAFSTVEFAEFMADLTGFDGLPEALQARIEAAAQVQAAPATPTVPGQSAQLVQALVKMGFGKGVVNEWVRSLGPRAESTPLPALVKDGIRALVSAPSN